jgi:RNase P subunit RPR2
MRKTYCDKCKKEVKKAVVVRLDTKHVDLCEACDVLFWEWLDLQVVKK